MTELQLQYTEHGQEMSMAIIPAPRSQYLDYVTAFSFRADDVQRLESSEIYKVFLGGECNRNKAVNLLETKPMVRAGTPKDLPGPVWDALRKEPALHCAYPYIFKPRVRLRAISQGEIQKGLWKSVHADCFVNAIGIAVHLQLGFDDWQREEAVTWGYDAEFSLLDKNGQQAGCGTIASLCLKMANVTLEALGLPWCGLRTGGWNSRMRDRGTLRRIYTELKEIETIDKKLLFGLATGMPGWKTAAPDLVKRNAFWPSSMQEGEAHCFAREGCAMLLKAGDSKSWRVANCHRRNVIRMMALHQMAYDHFRVLSGEFKSGGGQTPEWDAVLSGGVHKQLAQSRLSLLTRLHDMHSCMRYYSGGNLMEYVDRVANNDPKHRVFSPELVEQLRAQLSIVLAKKDAA